MISMTTSKNSTSLTWSKQLQNAPIVVMEITAKSTPLKDKEPVTRLEDKKKIMTSRKESWFNK
jgi:hypothetical protein